ncbi:hypothetical protein, partial [Intestinimonas massiliensis (ex Afouda et al. 2020)]|uniref:hypothetical protein n=1 Tax=Intestinimonas massiliensis (ex Afouda et al. 2020) TaxID=1673721 RepID=UPI001A9112F2
MRLEWRGSTLVITWLPVDAMGRLAALAPGSPGETEVLAALLAGARVYLDRRALEYRRYRRTAPAGGYPPRLRLGRRPGGEGGLVFGAKGRGRKGPPKKPPPPPADPFCGGGGGEAPWGGPPGGGPGGG